MFKRMMFHFNKKNNTCSPLPDKTQTTKITDIKLRAFEERSNITKFSLLKYFIEIKVYNRDVRKINILKNKHKFS